MVLGHPPSSDPALTPGVQRAQAGGSAHPSRGPGFELGRAHTGPVQAGRLYMSREVLYSQGNRGKVSNSRKQEMVSTEIFFGVKKLGHTFYMMFF